jgi:hypothetical protein
LSEVSFDGFSAVWTMAGGIGIGEAWPTVGGEMRYFLYAIYCDVQIHMYSYFLRRCVHRQTAIVRDVSKWKKRTF